MRRNTRVQTRISLITDRNIVRDKDRFSFADFTARREKKRERGVEAEFACDRGKFCSVVWWWLWLWPFYFVFCFSCLFFLLLQILSLSLNVFYKAHAFTNNSNISPLEPQSVQRINHFETNKYQGLVKL